jgi:hypothetical protein
VRSVLIVTYGRSGSTLLQGLLNAIPGYRITGENYNFLYHLYLSYEALIQLEKFDYAQSGVEPSHSFYGAPDLDPEKYVKSCGELAYNMLVPEKYRSSIRCFGFKEIRYVHFLNQLERCLDFYQRVFPDCKIIFNTRNHEDTAKSGWWSKQDKAKVTDLLERADSIFAIYSKKNPTTTFRISYEDIVQKSPQMPRLFGFLGEPFDENLINDVLRVEHSNRGSSKKEHSKRLFENELIEIPPGVGM